MSKTLEVVSTEVAVKKVPDVKVFGNPDLWRLICKASSESEGWMKSTKAMDTGEGCVIQVSTQQGDHVAEALVYVPGLSVDRLAELKK